MKVQYSIIAKAENAELLHRIENQALNAIKSISSDNKLGIETGALNEQIGFYLITTQEVEDDTNIICPSIGFIQEEGVNREHGSIYFNNFDITIACSNHELINRTYIGMHNKLCGLPDYMDNNVILRMEDKITVRFLPESRCIPVFLFLQYQNPMFSV